jgi:hypothetical protein
MAKAKKARLKEANAHLARARDQWDSATVDAWEPAEPADCVTKCFYSYENALVAAATAIGIAWTKKHYEKADLAKKLFEQNRLKTDISDLLARLNEPAKMSHMVIRARICLRLTWKISFPISNIF